MSVRASIAVTATAAALFTGLVSVSSVVDFAYLNPGLHVAVETAASLISLVAAQLVWGRFRQSLELRDLLLAGSLAIFAVTNLLFSAVPAIWDRDPGSFATWAPVCGRLLGASLMAASAVAPDRVLHRPMLDARRLFAALALGLAAMAVVVAVAGDALPKAIPANLSPEGGTQPRVVGNGAVLASELVTMFLFVVTAAGYARVAENRRDEMAGWLAVAGTLGAFSRLNFFLFPSLYSPYFYTGDVLRLGFFIAIAVGGMLEMRRLRAVLQSAAVLEERERIARELHDGVAQDLAFILQHGRRLTGRPDAPRSLLPLVTAAERALDECRHAIAALSRGGDETLGEAVVMTAVETAGREGALAETYVDGDISVPAGTQEALLRVTREAIINAIRHGGATTVKVDLRRDRGVRLVVSDDGSGFDVAQAAAAPGRMGLRSMEARVRAAGGRLVIDSEPGRGTRVDVSIG